MVSQFALSTVDVPPDSGVRTAAQLQRQDVLSVVPVLSKLLPEGIRRGTTITVASTSLTLLLLASATQAGSWAAVVGFPDLGMVAASELGVALRHCVLVPRVGKHPAKTIAMLVDAVDLVVLHRANDIGSADARRLIARVRERRAVLVLHRTQWPGITPLTLTVVSSSWQGLGQGDGHLRGRWLDVSVTGRGAFSRARNGSFWLGSGSGGENPYTTVSFRESGRSNVS